MNSSDHDSLDGIPGIGPSRRTMLLAAGITSRSQLAQMSVDQLVSVSALGRAVAQKALAFVHAPAPAAAPPFPEPPPVDEAFSAETTTEWDKRESADESAEAALTEMDRALFRATTALSDATRHAAAAGPDGAPSRRAKMPRPLPDLATQFAKLARVLENAPQQAPRLRPRRARRVVARLDELSRRLERWAARKNPLDPIVQERLRERLRDGRRVIEETLASAGQSSTLPLPRPVRFPKKSKKSS